MMELIWSTRVHKHMVSESKYLYVYYDFDTDKFEFSDLDKQYGYKGYELYKDRNDDTFMAKFHLLARPIFYEIRGFEVHKCDDVKTYFGIMRGQMLLVLSVPQVDRLGSFMFIDDCFELSLFTEEGIHFTYTGCNVITLSLMLKNKDFKNAILEKLRYLFKPEYGYSMVISSLGGFHLA